MQYYLSLLILAPFLWLLGAVLHGLIKTEALEIGNLAKSLRFVGLAGLTLILFVWLVAVVSPLAANYGWWGVSFVTIDDYLPLAWPWIVWILVITTLTGAVNHIILRLYSQERWGSNSPQYDAWPEFKGRAGRGGSRSTIWFNQSSWSPITSSPKASLSSRVKTKAALSSRSKSTNALSSRLFVLPMPSVRPASFKPAKSSRVGGSGKKGGKLIEAIAKGLVALGAIFKAILGFLVQLVIILALATILVFFGWLAYFVTDRFTDWLDEILVIPMYAEESAT